MCCCRFLCSIEDYQLDFPVLGSAESAKGHLLLKRSRSQEERAKRKQKEEEEKKQSEVGGTDVSSEALPTEDAAAVSPKKPEIQEENSLQFWRGRRIVGCFVLRSSADTWLKLQINVILEVLE